ncbi:MAG: succinate--CoA ligase subunit alpha [Desulfovibrionaceae bacterium]
MRLDEHDSKIVLEQAGIPQEQGVLLTPDDMLKRPPMGPPWILKALVRSGGRSEAGGVVRAASEEALKPELKRLFSLKINGEAVTRARLEPLAPVVREMYLSCSLSRERGKVLLTTSRTGYLDVDSACSCDLLIQELPSPLAPDEHHLRTAFFHLGLPRELSGPFMELAAKLVCAVRDRHLLLAEINPLALTTDGRLAVLDAKVEVDDFAPGAGLASMETALPGESEDERRARVAGLSYVRLDGFVGTLANGAGMAMASMDLLTAAGLPPANFLDVGGDADPARIRTAFDILFQDDQIKAVLVNLYGGILSCEKAASAMIEALGGEPPSKPLVVRMAGNGGAAGREILSRLDVPNLHLAAETDAALGLLHALTPGAKLERCTLNQQPPISISWSEAPKPGKPRKLPLDKTSPILVQGITGRQGRLHTRLMMEYGTNVVAGVTPFKGGERVEGAPVYNSVEQALRQHPVEASVIFVPAPKAKDAILEAIDNRIPWVICITEGVPQLEMIEIMDRLRDAPTRLIGPNSPGLLAPRAAKIGILPTDPFTPGPVAIVSRSGTLTYEAANRLSTAGLGQSVCIGVGGDPFMGTTLAEALDLLADHEPTKAVLMLGEIGGTAEEDAARRIKQGRFTKPVIGFIAGRSAPPGKRFGHAGAILDEQGPGVAAKLETMRQAGVISGATLSELPELVKSVL